MKVNIIDSCLLACWKLLVVALVISVVGHLFPYSWFAPKSSDNNGTAKGTTRDIKQTMDIVQQEHTLSTNYQILNALKFCHFETNCKTIKCCCIPEQLDPGEVTRIFIENIFKVLFFLQL